MCKSCHSLPGSHSSPRWRGPDLEQFERLWGMPSMNPLEGKTDKHVAGPTTLQAGEKFINVAGIRLQLNSTARFICSSVLSPTMIHQLTPSSESEKFTNKDILAYFHEHEINRNAGESDEALITSLAKSKSIQVTPKEHQQIMKQQPVRAVETTEIVESEEDDAWEWDAKEKRVRLLERCTLTGKFVWNGKYSDSQVRVLGDKGSYGRLSSSPRDLLALRTWHLDGEYLARYPRDANGDPVPPLDILAHEQLQCKHICTPRIFTDPNVPEQVYAVCAGQTRAFRCDYLICVSDIYLRVNLLGDWLGV
ncbi:hypothetical protein BT96DRAFT_937623 [Gymnopus androsaceus JB14]|uniref:Uncharacterized protein n=1 Tax=Gymnopus androsaceus JB14 TaxID=1447944 RepID=A0A6A4HRY0_9AGAR|nr:hypothetical protein BT96DRAFT_937623 [Gymnopus androsaceus JB14]